MQESYPFPYGSARSQTPFSSSDLLHMKSRLLPSKTPAVEPENPTLAVKTALVNAHKVLERYIEKFNGDAAIAG